MKGQRLGHHVYTASEAMKKSFRVRHLCMGKAGKALGKAIKSGLRGPFESTLGEMPLCPKSFKRAREYDLTMRGPAKASKLYQELCSDVGWSALSRAKPEAPQVSISDSPSLRACSSIPVSFLISQVTSPVYF